MANRKDGGRKTGCGLTVPRTDSILDFDMDRRTRWDHCKPLYCHGIAEVKGPVKGYRSFYSRTLEEMRMSLGWLEIDSKEIFISIEDWPPFESLFFVEAPIAYSRTCDKYVFDSCRFYPATITTDTMDHTIRCAVFDFRRENKLRARSHTKGAAQLDSGRGNMGFQIIVEEVEQEFFDGEESHEVEIEFVQRVSSVKRNRKPKGATPG